MQTILEITELFTSETQAERARNIRALLEQFLKSQLARPEADEP